jgi:hypothetical protein
MIEGKIAFSRTGRCEKARAAFQLGEQALAKGDFDSAERMFTRADMCDPDASEASDRLSFAQEARRRASALFDRSAPGGRKFDFLYAPTLRGLSTEFSSLVPLRPTVFSVPKATLDLAIADRTEASLLQTCQRQVLNDRPEITGGLVQHAYIAGQLAGPDVAERLAAVTTRRLFIHGVREPRSLLVSAFNHELIARYCGAYKFAPVYRDTLFDGEFDLESWRRDIRPRWRIDIRSRWPIVDIGSRSRNTPRPFPLKRNLAASLLEEMLSMPRHLAVGSCYAKHFDAWVPLNLARPADARKHIVQELYGIIGVEKQFYHPGFAVSEGTQIHRIMVQNLIRVKAFGHAIPVGLGFADRMQLSNTFDLGEIFWAGPGEGSKNISGGHPLCVTTTMEAWNTLPRDIRRRLVNSDLLVDFCNSVLVTAWSESYAAWQAALSSHLIREVSPSLEKRLIDRVGHDLDRFLKRHPHFEGLWARAEPAVGLEARRSYRL